MKRHSLKIVTVVLLIVTGLFSATAAKPTPTERIMALIQQQGFTIVEQHRTWLGRTRIIAKKGKYEREIIFRPATGEVLRDHWEDHGEEDDDDDDHRTPK